MKSLKLAEWQKELKTQPKIYWVAAKYGEEYLPTGNYYDSKNAAQFEVNWIRRKRNKDAIVRCSNLCNIKLANERWA